MTRIIAQHVFAQVNHDVCAKPGLQQELIKFHDEILRDFDSEVNVLSTDFALVSKSRWHDL